MPATIKTSVADLIARLNQAGGRAVKAVNDQMAIEAKGIKDKIIERMPVEFHNLEKSVKVKAYRRKEWTIYVDGDTPGHDGAVVGDYADYLNENDEWKPGEASQAKGDLVGNKFMERGLDAAIDGGAVDRCKDALRTAVEGQT